MRLSQAADDKLNKVTHSTVDRKLKDRIMKPAHFLVAETHRECMAGQS